MLYIYTEKRVSSKSLVPNILFIIDKKVKALVIV